ncbi:hypothetical protein VP1G_10556 [Cytospora mali]|uniref:Uncharacterized protein n=1 Tax=Cytospora mali TaxID=578113 RepID=A0A194UMX9_CYTMA|nr:hypothetical protein VP1G_10556 [Valsa mali var. pyri (nom. inval.)]
MRQKEAIDDQDVNFRQTATWTSVQLTPFDWAVIHNTETTTDLVPRSTMSKAKEGTHNEQNLATDAPKTPIKKRKAPYAIDPVVSPGRKNDIDVPDQTIGYTQAMCIAWACMLVGTLSYAAIVYTKEPAMMITTKCLPRRIWNKNMMDILFCWGEIQIDQVKAR